MTEKEEEDRKKRPRIEGYLYRDTSKYTIKDNDENSKKNVHNVRHNGECCDEYNLIEEEKWPFKREHRDYYTEWILNIENRSGRVLIYHFTINLIIDLIDKLCIVTLQ